jgi:hypothetical protein
MERAVIGIARVAGWLALVAGSIMGIMAIMKAPSGDSGLDPRFETYVQSTSMSNVIVGLALIVGALGSWALITTIAVAADAILDVRDMQISNRAE